MNTSNLQENIAQTLARELPKPSVLQTLSTADEDGAIIYVAVPKHSQLEKIDGENLLRAPRRTKAVTTLTDHPSFLHYVNEHKELATAVWCQFDPVTYKLAFNAVIDEIGPAMPAWRSHKASFTPTMSNEWLTWTENNRKVMTQLEFAYFIEEHEDDISAVDGFPSSLDMMKMATEFEARQDQAIKSTVRLQNGGVELAYVSNDDAQTIEKMRLFEKFKIGIPVFRGATEGCLLEARLRYRTNQGKASFWYELVRPDRAHEMAAKTMIETIKAGLNEVPVLMGSCVSA